MTSHDSEERQEELLSRVLAFTQFIKVRSIRLLLPCVLPPTRRLCFHRRFLGRLPKVDLIILEGGKCPSVRPSVRPSVGPQKVSSISMKFGI